MGAYVNGCYREDLDTVPGEPRLDAASIARLKAEAEACHSRIDRATRMAYRSALDRDGAAAPIDLTPEAPLLAGIRERVQVDGGDRRQLLADRAWLLIELDKLQEVSG